ncbi:MAG: hypothetical protein ACK5HO_03695 [Pseudomonadota bacterium]|jgi:hypothetical protein
MANKVSNPQHLGARLEHQLGSRPELVEQQNAANTLGDAELSRSLNAILGDIHLALRDLAQRIRHGGSVHNLEINAAGERIPGVEIKTDRHQFVVTIPIGTAGVGCQIELRLSQTSALDRFTEFLKPAYPETCTLLDKEHIRLLTFELQQDQQEVPSVARLGEYSHIHFDQELACWVGISVDLHAKALNLKHKYPALSKDRLWLIQQTIPGQDVERLENFARLLYGGLTGHGPHEISKREDELSNVNHDPKQGLKYLKEYTEKLGTIVGSLAAELATADGRVGLELKYPGCRACVQQNSSEVVFKDGDLSFTISQQNKKNWLGWLSDFLAGRTATPARCIVKQGDQEVLELRVDSNQEVLIAKCGHWSDLRLEDTEAVAADRAMQRSFEEMKKRVLNSSNPSSLFESRSTLSLLLTKCPLTRKLEPGEIEEVAEILKRIGDKFDFLS